MEVERRCDRVYKDENDLVGVVMVRAEVDNDEQEYSRTMNELVRKGRTGSGLWTGTEDE